jgi:hypothetical protein
MCEKPATVTAALGMLDHALDVLNGTDARALPGEMQAHVLRALERAGAKHTAARAKMLAAFTAQNGYEADGQGSARVWLRWQTRVTKSAAAGTVGWARRLTAHPVVAGALAAGEISASWAGDLCGWSERLPEDMRPDADQILVSAADGGADLADLAGLAEEMYQRTRPQHDDDGERFDDRWLGLDVTFGGTGRLMGDLTAGATAAVSAVLVALGRKAGPEDTRTAAQRRHDALAEACRRLIAAGMVPGRAGQPTQILVHMGLGQLRNLPGASAAEAAWHAARARQPGWLGGAEAQAAACDASMVPIVTGHLDPTALDHLADTFLASRGLREGQSPARTATAGPLPAGETMSWQSRLRLRSTLLAMAADALSGPGGLAARLRAAPGHPPLTAVSLPLDIGPAADTIPVHLRRLVTARHPHCAFPGCRQPARCATFTISSPAQRAAAPQCAISFPCAASTTWWPSTAGAGHSPSIPTAPPPPSAPMASAPSTATAHPPRPDVSSGSRPARGSPGPRYGAPRP